MKGTLLINACRRADKTVLAKSYFTSPFKLANISDKYGDDELRLMIMSSSPGVLDDDDLEIEINLEDGANLTLSTQSFQRLFTMKNGARQRTAITLGCNSALNYLPLPCVPHDQSMFISETTIHMNPGSRLTFGEVITCGRSLNGEQFKFNRLESRTTLFHGKKMLLKELIRMTPTVSSSVSMGLLEGFTHQANFIWVADSCQLSKRKEWAVNYLSSCTDIEWGLSSLSGQGIIIKLLGLSAYRLHAVLEKLAALATEVGA